CRCLSLVFCSSSLSPPSALLLLSSPSYLVLFFFLMIRRPPRSTLFPTRRSSDLQGDSRVREQWRGRAVDPFRQAAPPAVHLGLRSEEHTSELQSLTNLVCRLLLEKKKQ